MRLVAQIHAFFEDYNKEKYAVGDTTPESATLYVKNVTASDKAMYFCAMNRLTTVDQTNAKPHQKPIKSLYSRGNSWTTEAWK